MIPIISKDNKTLKLIRSLHRKKGRNDTGLYFAEGYRLVDEAVQYCGNDVEAILISDSFVEKNKDFAIYIDEGRYTVYNTTDGLFKDACMTETPQGIAAVLKIPQEGKFKPSEHNFVLVLDGISEPGNMGTIIRTAEAAGVDAVFLTKGCVDLYNPKTIRSTMGSVFRMNFFYDVSAVKVNSLKKSGFTIAATALKNSEEIGNVKIDGSCVLIIGSEAFGVSEEFLDISDVKIRIPMQGKAESLNAAVAAGIAMYMLKR